VIPRSEEAWKRSLLPQIEMALAAGHTTVYLAPGRFGERVAREHLGAPESATIQCANFVGDLLDACAEREVGQIVLVGHVGKLVKVAAGLFDTHSRVGDARLETTAALAAAAGAPSPLVQRLLSLPTVEAAVPLLRDAGLDDVWDDVARRAAARATERVRRAAEAAGRRPPGMRCVLTSYDAVVIGDSTSPAAAETGVVTVVGVGPGAEEWLTPAAWRAVCSADVVAGGARQLECFAPPGTERVVIGADIVALTAALRRRLDRHTVVLASGDPTCYGILATLRRELPDVPLRVVPGISSVQLALARLGASWHEVRLASAHGQPLDGVVNAVRESPRVLALTDRRGSPASLAGALVHAGVPARLTVLERLGYPDERITHGDPAGIAAGNFDPLSLVYVEREETSS
ncbi:MAG: precorrin-6y C5,15-methyltransferase (decarboxylating) subunit CbiE, partial [Actinobacteria bacterium]|nr:precorrin-6y C5,15-methyltransferase (decarboxylating) subunit CbiE [Actinomycetota bacterium]